MPGWMSFLLTLLVDELHPDKRERLVLIKRIIDSHLSSTNEAASPFHPPAIGWPRLATDKRSYDNYGADQILASA